MNITKKDKLIIVVFLLGLLAILGGSLYYEYVKEQRQNNYDTALVLMQQENYAEAKVLLGDLPKDYSDSAELYLFCDGMLSYEKGYLPNAAKKIMNCNFAEQDDEIRELFLSRKETILDKKAVYDAEMDRIRQEQEAARIKAVEERKKKEAEAERKAQEEYMRRIHEGVPFVGMPEKYIDETSLGKHSDSYTNTNIINNKKVKGHGYFFEKDGYQIFFVFCRYGVVESVADQRDSIEYQKQRRAEKKKEAQKKKENKVEDPYNASDYGYADDFYEDYYDEFYDFVDAEDYWEEHYEE